MPITSLKVFVAGCVAAALLSLPAAADSSWNGAYAGISVGSASSSIAVLDGPQNVAPNCWWCSNDYGKHTRTGFVGGQLGYNKQFNHIVVGIEAQISSAMVRGATSDPTHLTPTGVFDGGNVLTATARLGYAFDNVLVYGRIGAGTSQQRIDWADPAFSATASSTKWVSGAVFGGGIEWAFARSLSLDLDYQHLNLGNSSNLTTVVPVGFPFGGWHEPVATRAVDAVRLGLNVKLSGD